MRVSEFKRFIERVESLKSRKQKSELLATLSGDEARLVIGNFQLNSIGTTILGNIFELDEADMEVSEYMRLLTEASNVSSRTQKIEIMKSIELDPAYKKFMIKMTKGTQVIGARISSSDLELGVPFYPQLCATATQLDPTQYVVEEKLDGIRVVAHRTEDGVILQSRNLKSVTIEAVEAQIMKLEPGTIVDGEVVGAQSNNMQSLRRHSDETQYVVFDCLMSDNQPLKDLPLLERKSHIPSSLTQVKVFENLTDWEQVRDIVYEMKIEGIVAKLPNSTYNVGKREWLKWKPVKELTAKVISYNFGTGRRADTVGSINIEAPGIAKTKVGSGFSDEQLEIMKQRIDSGVETFVDVKYQDLTKDKCLRFPIFLRIRHDTKTDSAWWTH